MKYISGTILDDRPIRVDFDWGFQEGRQWGRGRSGGQVSLYNHTFSFQTLSSIVSCHIFSLEHLQDNKIG